MSGKSIIIIVIVSIVMLLLLGVGGTVMWMSTPTQGPKVGEYKQPRTAILVVDIQEDLTGPDAKRPYKDSEKLVAATNFLISRAEANGALVVYIANIIKCPFIRTVMGGIGKPDAPGTAIDRRIQKVTGGPTFTKTRGDAFSNPELDAYLQKNQVDNLVIAGLDAAYCVNATIHGAVNRGYKVTVFTEAVATESNKKISDLAEGWKRAGVTVSKKVDW